MKKKAVERELEIIMRESKSLPDDVGLVLLYGDSCDMGVRWPSLATRRGCGSDGGCGVPRWRRGGGGGREVTAGYRDDTPTAYAHATAAADAATPSTPYI